MLHVVPGAATIFGYAPKELGADIESMAFEEPGLTALLEARARRIADHAHGGDRREADEAIRSVLFERCRCWKRR